MKAVVVHGARDIRWEEIPEPDVRPGWARVDIRAAGICSSDVPRALDGTAYHYPIVLGHELAGVVSQAGKGVDRSLIGKRVAVAPLIPCRKCEWCAEGRFSLCDSYDYLGSRRNGGCAEALTAPAENLVPLPDAVSDEAGALLEPSAVAWHGLEGRVQSGDRVAVMGAGSLGLLAAQIAALLGALEVLVLDPLVGRLAVAQELGATPIRVTREGGEHEPVLETTSGRGVDLTLVATGAAIAIARAPLLTRKGGKVVLLGLSNREITLPPAVFNRLVRSELQLFGSWNSFSRPFPGDEWSSCLSHFLNGQLRTGPIVTHRFSLEQAEAAYRLIEDDPESVIKAILTPTQGGAAQPSLAAHPTS